LPHTANPIRQPVVAPVVETCTVFGQEMPICMESVHMALAEKLGLPGHGKDGFGPGDDFTHFDQYYLKMAANVAWGHKEDDSDAVPEADDAELALFQAARKHLPATIYDYDRWRKAAGDDHWRRVVYLLNRGGRFEDFEKAYAGDHLGHKYGKLLTVYNDLTPQMVHSGTGKRLPGIGEWRWVEDFHGRNVLDMDKEAGYEFILTTYKIVGGANYRGIAPHYWLLETTPENYVVMHTEDAARLGLQDGDLVKLVSASNPEGMWDLKNGQRFPCGGKVKTTTGIRRGVLAVAWSFGHWAYGATDVVVNGEVVKGDPRRGGGFNPNAVFRLDPVLKDVTPSDPVGGQQALPSRVNVVKMTPAEVGLLQAYVPGQVYMEGVSKTYLGGA
jgi:anaerobic selenocysteine-containing dehydrogenase